MRPRIYELSSTQLALALATSKQAAHSLLKRFGSDICGDPLALFHALAGRYSSKLRNRLACPIERDLVATRIAGLREVDLLLERVRAIRAAVAKRHQL